MLERYSEKREYQGTTRLLLTATRLQQRAGGRRDPLATIGSALDLVAGHLSAG